MHTNIPTQQPVSQISGLVIEQRNGQGGRRVKILPSARFAAAVQCDVKVHSLWRSGPWDFGFDTAVVPLASAPPAEIQLRGPLLLDIAESESRVELRLHRSCAVDTAPSVRTACQPLASRTGARLLDDHAELRDAISRVLSTALDRQMQIELETALEAAQLSTPLFVVSIPKGQRTEQVVESCMRGDFHALWTANIYTHIDESGTISSLMRQPRTVPVQISYLDRKQWQHADLFFRSAETCVTDAGEILVTSPLFDTQESCEDSMLIASQERRRRSSSNLSVRATINCTVDQLKYFAPAEVWVRAKAFAASQPATSPREVKCEFCLSIPRHALEAWFSTPRAGSGSFGPVYSVMSRSVQKALRRWVPAFWTEPMKKAHTRMAALLARLYGYSEPAIGMARADLVPDWMSEDAAAHVWQTGALVLRRKIAEEKIGTMRTPHQCDVYARRQVELLSEWIWKDRLIPGLLQMEAMLVEAFIQLGSNCRELDDSGKISNAMAVRRSIFEPMAAARRTMRKFFMKVDYSDLVPMLFIEATNALNRTLGREYPVTVNVNVRAPSGAEKKIFNQAANFPAGRHYIG